MRSWFCVLLLKGKSRPSARIPRAKTPRAISSSTSVIPRSARFIDISIRKNGSRSLNRYGAPVAAFIHEPNHTVGLAGPTRPAVGWHRVPIRHAAAEPDRERQDPLASGRDAGWVVDVIDGGPDEVHRLRDAGRDRLLARQTHLADDVLRRSLETVRGGERAQRGDAEGQNDPEHGQDDPELDQCESSRSTASHEMTLPGWTPGAATEAHVTTEPCK